MKKTPSTLEIIAYEFATGKLHEHWHGNKDKEALLEEKIDMMASRIAELQEQLSNKRERQSSKQISTRHRSRSDEQER